jgi:hypothetical protein
MDLLITILTLAYEDNLHRGSIFFLSHLQPFLTPPYGYYTSNGSSLLLMNP